MMLILKNLIFTLLIPGTAAIYVPLLINRGRSISSNVWLITIGALLMAGGLIVYLWTVWDFATIGGGTPLPLDAPKKLVVRGLYRYTRNPMYLGVLLVILGWVVLFSNAWLLLYAAGVAIIIHLFIVFYEEPRLQQLFGREYSAYRQAVGRWLPHRPIWHK